MADSEPPMTRQEYNARVEFLRDDLGRIREEWAETSKQHEANVTGAQRLKQETQQRTQALQGFRHLVNERYQAFREISTSCFSQQCDMAQGFATTLAKVWHEVSGRLEDEYQTMQEVLEIEEENRLAAADCEVGRVSYQRFETSMGRLQSQGSQLPTAL
ncbi:MAG: hypothetical protein Q9221_008375 [Calogaya cf. arnoldii]